MAERTLAENVAQVKADFKGIRYELVNKGASVPSGTPTSQYANIIKDLNTGGGNTEEAFEAGRQDVISKSKYIPKTASGKGVFLNDVSEVAHKVVVKADTPTEVKVCGKNLFDGVLEVGGIDSTTGNNTNSTTSTRSVNYIPVAPNTTYTITREITEKKIYTRFYDKNKTYIEYGFSAVNTPMTFTAKEGYAFLRLELVGGIVDEKVQVEFGSDTEYEPYNSETITATPNGTEANSICPIMYFLTDSEITVDYYSSYGRAEADLAHWNAVTVNGTRQHYNYAFAYTNFSGYTIPEGLCRPTSSLAYMFHQYQGVEMPRGIDCSKFVAQVATNQCYYTFYYASKLKKIYDMGIPAGIAYGTTYGYCSALEEIEKIRCNENTTFNTNAFNQCTSLKHIGFEGTIASDINLQWHDHTGERVQLQQCAWDTIHLPEKIARGFHHVKYLVPIWNAFLQPAAVYHPVQDVPGKEIPRAVAVRGTDVPVHLTAGQCGAYFLQLPHAVLLDRVKQDHIRSFPDHGL